MRARTEKSVECGGIVARGLASAGEELDAGEPVGQGQGLGVGVDGRAGPVLDRVERDQLVAVLDCGDGRVVRGAVGLGPADDPHVRCRGVDHLGARRELAGVPGAHDGVLLRAGAGGALAEHREHIRPHVQHRQQKVSVPGVGDRQPNRTGRQVQPGVGVQGVEVRAHHRPVVGRRELAQMLELIRGPKARLHPGRKRSRLVTGDVHRHQRIQIEERLTTQRLHVIGQLAHASAPVPPP